MKARSFGKYKRGVATLEILIAFTILILSLTAVILVVFGNQSISIDTQTNDEALSKAQAQFEEARVQARKDFDSLATIAPTTEDIYQKSLEVESIDSFTKKVTSIVSWSALSRTLSVRLTTLITDSQPGGMCTADISANWQNPAHYEFKSEDLMPGNNSNGIGIADIKVIKQKMYVAARIPANTNDTFYIFDLPEDPSVEPTYVGSLDNAPSTSDGLAAIAVGGSYAYVANAHDANFQTCTQGASCAQLQIINVAGAAPAVIKNYKLPSASAPFVLGNMSSTDQAVGKSIFYSGGYVYLGLSKTASGPEFNIIDVHDPQNPFWVGSYAVGRSVGSIAVKGQYAYVSTDDNSRELLILDISNKANPTPVGLYNAPGSNGFGYGRGVSMVGNTLYFGRSFVGNNSELYVLNNTNPASTLSPLGSKDIGTSASPDSVNGIEARGNLVFLLTNKAFQIWDAVDPSNIAAHASLSLADFTNGAGNGTGTALDCSGNYFYIALASPQGNNKDIISIITPGASAPQPFDYSLTPAFASLSVNRGASVSNNITIAMTGGTPQAVTLSASGMQNGVAVTMNPASGSCTPNTSCVVMVTFTAASNAQKKKNTITITGASPAHTTTFDLTVN